jgi:hypothetical protein
MFINKDGDLQQTTETTMGDNRFADQASKVACDVKEGIAGAVKKAGDFAEKARTTAAETANTVQVATTEAGRSLSDVATEMQIQGVKAREYLRSNTAKQPLLALLLAGAVGYAIAYLMHRR